MNDNEDTVLMDIKSHRCKKDNLIVAERLLSAETARLSGVNGYTIDQFKQNMLEAIARGANSKNAPAET
ncbi:hypothetical protein AGMMS50212_03620 [Spirochaetia bacterium]|nr:hypothetical protein AGMMS50212_03620 [Spirochaetia bacterium]